MTVIEFKKSQRKIFWLIYEIDDVGRNDGRYVAGDMNIRLRFTTRNKNHSINQYTITSKKVKATYDALGADGRRNQFGAVLQADVESDVDTETSDDGQDGCQYGCWTQVEK